MRRSATNSAKVGRNTTRVGGEAAGIDPERLIREWSRRYPSKTSEHVAAELGAPVRTVANWLARAATPSFAWLGVIVCRSEPEFLEAVMVHPSAWIVAAARQARRIKLDVELARVRDALAREGVEA